jgi:hypothetical protein
MIAPLDANDILRTQGADALRQRVDGAAARPKLAWSRPRVDEEASDGAPNASAEDGGIRKRKFKQADRLIGIATSGEIELYHAPDGTCYADIPSNGHRQTWPLKSTGYRRWLRRAYYEATGGAPNGESMTTAIGVIEAKAQFDGQERSVHLRAAEHGGRIYLDMCDATWRVIEICADGWRIVSNPPVRFRRTAGMRALPEPTSGGEIDELRHYLQLKFAAYVLVISWLLAAMRGRGPYPILALAGEQGVGKSTAAELLRRLIDPHAAALRALPHNNRDLYIAANNGHVIALDNLSGIPTEISDSLCRLATGGGFATRALHTDSDEILFTGQRPIILTSIEDVATRSDLADRALLVTLEPIADHKRRSERELWAGFEEAAPRILGAVLDALAHGLCRLPETRLTKLPRMADYALWAAACETALWPAGTHVDAYANNRRQAVDTVLDADPVAMALRQHLDGSAKWEGTATALLDVLGELVAEHIRRSRDWPASARALSSRLTRLAPSLRRVGITIDREREAHTGRRYIHIATSTRAAP